VTEKQECVAVQRNKQVGITTAELELGEKNVTTHELTTISEWRLRYSMKRKRANGK